MVFAVVGVHGCWCLEFREQSERMEHVVGGRRKKQKGDKKKKQKNTIHEMDRTCAFDIKN